MNFVRLYHLISGNVEFGRIEGVSRKTKENSPDEKA